jgi:6-hydroxycyclohex-1-ene-1-carbonyl-CoA dehydrogenase
MVQPTACNKETGETIPGKLELVEIPVPELKTGEVLVEVAGCGVCNEDLGYFYDGVPTVCKPPLALGREISGTVIAGDPTWIGKEVLIPAVMPCRQCHLCQTGRGNRCLNQKMPGNSIGIYGGFSSHIPVPSMDLCEVKDRKGIPLEHLAVVANAVTTPFQAAKRASLNAGDNVIVIGVGGTGQYIVQMVKALGANTVIAVDIVETHLQNMLKYGADFVINATGKGPKEVAAEVKRIRDRKGLPGFGWKIFEATGSKSGQETALNLLSYTGKLIIVGFGMTKIEYAMGRLMAFDAEIIGTWGCLPEYYPQVLEMVTSSKIALSPFVQTRPMSWIRKVFEDAHKTPPDRRIILTTDDLGLDDSPEPKSCR